MKPLVLLLFISVIHVFTACNGTPRSAFEQETGIAIPADAEEIQSYDDGKFVKTNHFLIDTISLKAFINTHNFSPFTREKIPEFWGYGFMKLKPDFNNLNSLYYKSGTGEKNSWIYIADLKTGGLWTEIKYQGKPAY